MFPTPLLLFASSPVAPGLRLRLPFHFSSCFALAVSLGCWASCPSQAATITWGAPTSVSADSNVSTLGTLVYAYNITENAAVSPVTVNGVTFARFAVGASDSPVTVGAATLKPTAFFDGKNTGLGSSAAPFVGLTSAYRTLLDRATTDYLSAQITLTLGGLTSGQSYLVQFWSNDSAALFWNAASDDTKTLFSAGNTVTLDMNNTNAEGGLGQWVTGTFVASGPTQDVTIGRVGASHLVLNAFQLRQIPEPSSVVLLGCAGLSLVLARRRRTN